MPPWTTSQKGKRERKQTKGRKRWRNGSVSWGPHSYISYETKTERSLGRGRTFCRSVADAETAKRPDNPFLLSPRLVAFFSRGSWDPETRAGPWRAVLCSLYVRQCRETAAERGKRERERGRESRRNDLRLGRGRFGPLTRRRWASRGAPVVIVVDVVVGVIRRHRRAYLRIQERRQVSHREGISRKNFMSFRERQSYEFHGKKKLAIRKQT